LLCNVQSNFYFSYIDERLTQAKGFILGEIGMVIALALAWRKGWLPSLALLAFAPVLGRGLAWFFSSTSRLQIRRLGIGELIHVVTFAALLIVSFHPQI
jgi:hypothetical protein